MFPQSEYTLLECSLLGVYARVLTVRVSDDSRRQIVT
jgi:hypothetical protein